MRPTNPIGKTTAPERCPDAILLDIGRSPMDDYEVCRRLRLEPWGHLEPSLP
jgi:CheY-like chemotaxis protein